MQKLALTLLADEQSQGTATESLGLKKETEISNVDALSPILLVILQDVQRELGFERFDSSENSPLSSTELIALVKEISQRHGFELSNVERDEILSRIEREQKPFGVLQELVDDSQVSDIIVSSYSKVAVQQGRLNYQTDISFSGQDAYEAFVERLLMKAGSTYSTKRPIADGMLGGFARIHVVHKSLAEEGPYLTIRLNRFSEVTLESLLKLGLAPYGVLAYLSAIISSGHTVLVVGEVGTGKTTLARALAGEMPNDESILVIEDTPEIQLSHPHVRYVRTREANSDGAGRISPSECIRGGMRMAMNRIIFGEMRDAEAAEAFVDVCASGHPGISTIHGRSNAEAITRLELFLGRAQQGVARDVLSKQIATAVQVVVHVDICKHSGRRRIMEVRELGPLADGVLRQKKIFEYQLKEGVPLWNLCNRVSSYREKIEALSQQAVLSKFPAVLELDLEVVYREAAYLKSRSTVQ